MYEEKNNMDRENFVQLEPSLISAQWAKMGEEAVSCCHAGIKVLHLDIMDGHFVPNLTMGPDMVRAIRENVCSKTVLDVHLMLYNPCNFVDVFKKAGSDEMTFHLEAVQCAGDVIDCMRDHYVNVVGLAIQPETSDSKVLRYLSKLDKVLVMTVSAGFGGQKFLPEMLKKVSFLRKEAHRMGKMLHIQVDGGINYETAMKSVEAGANRLVSGSHFFAQKDRREACQMYSTILRKFSL